MNVGKGKYKTRHSEEMLEFLETMQGKHVTVADVCEFFKGQGKNIGMTTVYRQMERMVDEGLVNKYVIDANTPACFEFTGAGSHCDSEVCFHCKCTKCGRLIHLDCDELRIMQEHLLGEHGFELDPQRTVFYGLCEFCRDPEKVDGEETKDN